MSLFGANDAITDVPKIKPYGHNSNFANAYYQNTTISAFTNNRYDTVLAVDKTEIGVVDDKVLRFGIVAGGTGYVNSTSLAFTGAATTNAAATITTNSTGGIASLTISNNGVGYANTPTVTATSPVSTTVTISSAGASYNSTVNNQITFTGGGGSGAVAVFTNNASGNITGVVVSNAGNNYTSAPVLTITTPGGGSGANLVATLVGSGSNLYAYLGEGKKRGIPHTGWVMRREGIGGRAGRVTYEVLVAGGINTSNTGDDTILPDS